MHAPRTTHAARSQPAFDVSSAMTKLTGYSSKTLSLSQFSLPGGLGGLRLPGSVRSYTPQVVEEEEAATDPPTPALQ